MGVDRHLLIVEVELGVDTCKVKVCVIEGLDGSDVLPEAVEEEGCNRLLLCEVRDDLLSEVSLVVVKGLFHCLGCEDVDSH